LKGQLWGQLITEMKLIHISDLHLGKRIYDFSMTDEQEYILNEIIAITDREKPEALIIAGDIYDKSVPSSEAVLIFDNFLYKLSQRGLKVFVISGNHDSPERIAFGGRLMNTSGVYMSPVYSGKTESVSLSDKYGMVNIYMLPFFKPAAVRGFFPDSEIITYTDAVRAAVGQMKLDVTQRNILIAHQFVTGAARTESEDISVGGTDGVDMSVFSEFDYVALGHIHRAQKCGNERIRYCGTPLKYSFSESGDQKSVTVIELKEKNDLNIRTVDLCPLHDLFEIKGCYDEISSKKFYENSSFRESFLHITLTDEEEIPYAAEKLRVIYNRLMKLDYDNTRTRSRNIVSNDSESKEQQSPSELFSALYELQNNAPMSCGQMEYVNELIDTIWSDR